MNGIASSRPDQYKNTLLRHLNAETIERLQLHPVVFKVGYEIEFPGNPIRHLYFVEQGMASMTNTFGDGSQVEVGMFGHEGVIGISALMGTKRSLNRIYTQIAGSGYSTTLLLARQEFRLGGLFQALTLRFVQTQLVQAMQSAGCNAKHEVDQRLARWLLLCADRTHSTTYLLSQEFLADMLGSTRSTVSVAAGVLKAAGLIEYSRGKVRIPDVAALEGRACECYRVIKNHLDSFSDFEQG